MKCEQIEAIEIAEKEAFLVKVKSLNKYKYKYLLNGDEISEIILKDNFVISKADKVQCISRSKELDHYKRGEETISLDLFKSKPTYYDDDSSDEDTLRAIANKKELAGFEPIYNNPEPKDIDLVIAGSIIDTESKFIDTYINSRYSKDEVLFSTGGGAIAMDEYLELSEKHSDHARFQKPDRAYLRFTQINGKYVFGDSKPFGDNPYRKSFTSLDEAKKEEAWVRNEVRRVVETWVFNENVTEVKKVQILSNLKLIRKLKTLKSKDASIDVLIKDISEYLKSIK